MEQPRAFPKRGKDAYGGPRPASGSPYPPSPRVLEKKAEAKGLEKRVSGENGKELAKLPRRASYF